jgi:hypothetical protein
MSKISSAYCPTCDQQRMHSGKQPNHILHLLLSCITFGIWLPVWLVLSVARKPRCMQCGMKQGAARAESTYTNRPIHGTTTPPATDGQPQNELEPPTPAKT